MKKNVLLFSTILLFIGLAAFAWLPENQSEVDFVYDLSPRYVRTFTKTEIGQVRSVADFEDPEKMKRIVSYQSVVVSTFDDKYEPIIEVHGETAEFNDEQLIMLQSVNYSDDILIRTEYMINKNGKVETSYTTPHITIVPEIQTEYAGGNQAFLDYVKSHKVHQSTKISKESLKPGKVRLTISKKGTISNVILISTSGYDKIDKQMVELISEAPGSWKAALDSHGQPVEQQLVCSFGITGC
jgi:hypothetical protein